MSKWQNPCKYRNRYPGACIGRFIGLSFFNFEIGSSLQTPTGTFEIVTKAGKFLPRSYTFSNLLMSGK